MAYEWPFNVPKSRPKYSNEYKCDRTAHAKCQYVVLSTITDILTLINLLLFQESRWPSVVEERDVW